MPARALDRRRLVIVSEDKLFGELLRYGLSAKGFSVTVVQEGTDPKTVIDQFEPDAVVLDVFLGVNDAFRLLNWLRDEAKGDIPSLVLSCTDNRAFAVEALVAGARDVLIKPVVLPTILERLKRFWNESIAVRDSIQEAR